ncbi:hypothetical protein [Acidithiobacillus sp.]
MIQSSISKNYAVLTVSMLCLAVATPSFAEKVTERVPDSPHLREDLRAAARSGTLTIPQGIELNNYIFSSPGDLTKNGDIPEYNVTVAGLNHFYQFSSEFFSLKYTDLEKQLKLPVGCRWIPNPPALSPIIPPHAKVSFPVHISQWRVISCSSKTKGVTKEGVSSKTWTWFIRFYQSATSASVQEARALVTKNLRASGYKEVNYPGYTGACGDNPSDACPIFYNLEKHANVYPIISSDIVPPSLINHPENITKYAPMISPLKDYLHSNNTLTVIDITEVSLTPLDVPAIPIRGLDTAFSGIPGKK